MKKIHKQIIAKQALCLDKALKKVKLKQNRNWHYKKHVFNLDDTFIDRIKNNNAVFSRAIDSCFTMKASSKAKIIRKLFKHKNFKHRNNSINRGKYYGRDWALWYYGSTFDFKFFITEEIFNPDNSWGDFTPVSKIIELAKKFR